MSKLANVWVFSDINDRYAELLAAARQLGDNVTALVLGTKDDVAQAISMGADVVYDLGEQDAQRRTEDYADTIAAVMGVNRPVPRCCWVRPNAAKHWLPG